MLTPAQRRRALGGVIGPAAFVGAWAVGGATESGYSPVHDPISELAQSGASTRVLMTAGFVVFGVAVTMYATALRAALPGWAWFAAFVAGIATLGVAAFPLGSPTSDSIHGLFVGTGYVALAATPPLAAPRLDRRRPISIVVGVISAVCLAATLAGPAHGLFQRLGLTVVDAWIVATAVAMYRRGGLPATPTPRPTR